MNNTVFLNRKLEKENIKNYLLKNKNNPYVLFIASTTGVGKTSLINKVIQDTKIQNFLRVTSTNDKSNRDRDGFIIKQMVKSVFFQKTQEKCNNPSQLISDLKAIVLEYINSKLNSQTLEKKLWELVLTKNTDNIVYEISADNSIEQLKFGMKRMLSQKAYTISIENIQNIDLISLEFLRNLLISLENITIIGEVTLSSKESRIEGDKLLQDLSQEKISCNLYELQDLPVSEIAEFFENKSKKDILDRVLKTYLEQKQQGNLYQIQGLLAYEKSDQPIDERKISELPNEKKCLLILIVLHGGAISYELLQEMLLQAESYKYIKGLENHITSDEESSLNNRYYKYERGNVCVCHDSIIEQTYNLPDIRKHEILGNTEWLRFYKNFKKKNSNDFHISLQEIISWELYFRTQVDDNEGLEETLETVYRQSLKSATPRRIIAYYEAYQAKFKNPATIENKNQINIQLMFARIFYRLGLFKKVDECTKKIRQNNIAFVLNLSSSLLIGNTQGLYEKASKKLEKITYKSSFWLSLQLFLIQFLRATNRYDECEKLWHKLQKEKVFDGTSLFPVFLKSADMALFSNPPERKALLIKAINLFEKQNDKLQEMATRISLSQHLGYSGELNAALEHLKIAEEISKHEIDGYFITQNNLAVISLFSHIASPECGAQLERALSFCSNDNYLDRLIIINNLLIYSSITKSISEAMGFISKLEEILVNYCDSLDYDLKRITLFNIAQHHRDTPLHKFYIEKAREIPLTIDCEYWNYRLNNHKPISKNFRMLHEYYPIFISNWNLDFDIFLNS